MKKIYDITTNHTQQVAVIISIIAILLADLAAFEIIKRIPNTLVATWSPRYGAVLYSFKTSIIFFVDLILFVIFFPIVRSLLKRIGITDWDE